MGWTFNPFTGTLDKTGGTGTTVTPGGTNTEVQFNDGGAFGGTTAYWDKNNLRLGINTSAPGESLDVVGNFQVADAMTSTKSYRFRTNGSNLDIEGAGKDIFLSVWSGANYTGTQYNYFRLEAGTNIGHAIGKWLFDSGPFGGGTVTIDGANGNTTIGGSLAHQGTTLGFYNTSPITKPANIPTATGNITSVQNAINATLALLQSLGLMT